MLRAVADRPNEGEVLKMFNLSRLRLRAKVALATTAFAMVAALPLALNVQPAAAWPWDPHVHVAGHAGCNQMFDSPTLVQMWAQGAYAQAGFNWATNYGLDFWGIGGSSTAWALITCDGLGGHYQYWRSFTVYRPGWGNQINVSFQG
jgi:hypothetical protein